MRDSNINRPVISLDFDGVITDPNFNVGVIDEVFNVWQLRRHFAENITPVDNPLYIINTGRTLEELGHINAVLMEIRYNRAIIGELESRNGGYLPINLNPTPLELRGKHGGAHSKITSGNNKAAYLMTLIRCGRTVALHFDDSPTQLDCIRDMMRIEKIENRPELILYNDETRK